MRFKAIFLTLFLCTAILSPEFSPKFNQALRLVPDQLRCALPECIVIGNFSFREEPVRKMRRASAENRFQVAYSIVM
jgi:hypothetical protein